MLWGLYLFHLFFHILRISMFQYLTHTTYLSYPAGQTLILIPRICHILQVNPSYSYPVFVISCRSIPHTHTMYLSYPAGKVLTVETVNVPIVNGNVESGGCSWSESTNEDSPYAFVLRLFFTREEPAKENIGN